MDIRVIQRIVFPSPIEENDPENDNIDVHVYLDDGRVYSFLVATPNNIFRCMGNEGIDFYFSFPPAIFVNRLTAENVERALQDLLNEDKEKWLEVYGVLQRHC